MFFKINKDKKNEEKILLDECKNLVEKNDIDSAINKLEKYIEENKKLGKVFTYLMELYNKQLSEARLNGEDEKIKFNLDRIDKLMQKSKDIVRGR
ncbi:hypothetical protein I6H45_02250 [Anaerococcus vaginalis]|uniref:Uncharacterized protein n=2 Tax=Anaerococcus vaginalis TaxID=33037 RepID=C7HSJ6_9FIRM|nr:hypothetical protein [Anaerococcus vaginalis]EEU13112.1 hypothetical protein HMPREF0078_0246 [Anaerococcus vaginalis ATCC 51170]QQB62316.1 hypothetical protein I6H45_02250 [Anaerococcus vaginalis]